MKVSAPGRVCLVGDHCDYARGKCLSFSLPQRVYVKGKKNNKEIILKSFFNSKFHELRSPLVFNINNFLNHPLKYPLAVIKVLQDKGLITSGVDLTISSDLPSEKGLSSSAAISVATTKFFNEFFNLGLSKIEVAEIAYIAEHDILGVDCGRQDQLTSVHESFVLLNFSKSQNPDVEVIQYPKGSLYFLVGIPLNTKRSAKTLLKAAYNAYSHPKSLKDKEFKRALDDYIPNQVANPMKSALKKGDIKKIGFLMRKNQELYDKYFTPISKKFRAKELYHLLETAKQNGSLGEKWTGAGGSGSFICLLKSPQDRNQLKKAFLKEPGITLEFIDISY